MKVQKFLKLFVVVIFCVKLSACEEIPIVSYTVENAVPFNGENATTESANCKYDSIINLRECEPGSKLDDDNIGGTIGVQQPLNTYEDFFAFSRASDEPGILQFYFPSNYSDQINIFLYFFYEPNGRFEIGVPFISIETFDGVDLPFTFGQNSDLHSNDATIRNISLVVYIPPHVSINGVYMSFTFPNNNPNNWFLLSEVDIFDFDFILFQREEDFNSVVLGPDSLQSSIGFTCTVINSGSYEWYWEGNNGQHLESTDNRHMFWVGAATRSSQLEINQLRYSDRGNYSCIVKNSRLNTTLHQRTFELTLNAELNVNPNKDTFPLGSTASIDCEIFGYVPGEIEWRRDGEVIQPVGIYTITQSAGDSISSISTDGVPISSRILTLGIKGFNETRAGRYTCGVAGDIEAIEMNITLVVGEPVGPLEMIRNCINPDTLYALVGVNVVTASLQVIANIIYHECCRIKCKRKKSNFKKPKLPDQQQTSEEKKRPRLTRAKAVDKNRKKYPFLQRTDSIDLGTEELGMHLPNTNGSHSPFIKRLPFVNGGHGDDGGGPLEEVRDSAFNIGRKLKENVGKSQIYEMANTVGHAAGPTAAATILTGSVLGANNCGNDKSSSAEQQEDNKSGTSLPVSQMSFRQESDDIFEEDHSLLPKGLKLPETSVHGFGQTVKTSWLGKKLQGRLPENQKEMIPMITPSGIPAVIFSGADDEEQKKQVQSSSDDIPTSIGQELTKMVEKAKDLVPNAMLVARAGHHETGEQSDSLATQVTGELTRTIGGRVSPLISSFVELNPAAWLKEKTDHSGQGVGKMIDKVKGNQPASPVLNDGVDGIGQKRTALIVHLPTSMPLQGEITKVIEPT